MSHGRTRTIRVDALSRVEGGGGLTIRVRGGRVVETRLRIFEPPRFFEAFLRGRRFDEAPDITARICGICPVAYQLTAAQAMEDALGVRVEGQLHALRRLLYCGEWIASHALHIHLLHAPDFLGYPDAARMAADHGDAVRRGLMLKEVGNAVMEVLGGRAIHPISVRVGGFHHVPSRADLAPLAERLRVARDAARDTVRWVAAFDVPDFEVDYEFVALQHADTYAFGCDGRLVSNRGLDAPPADFAVHVVEEQVPHSTALHAGIRARGAYLCGPLARWALGRERLPDSVRAAARDAGVDGVCRNPFRSIVVRALEVLWACEEALAIIDAYEPPALAALDVVPRAATGHAATEAPRGLLYHRYVLDDDGLVGEARIVPPTSQNQRQMEEDLRAFVGARLGSSHDALTWQCEHAVRSYDPCISCATHFLTLRVEET